MQRRDGDQDVITILTSPRKGLVPLNVVLADYDRTRRIIDGRVKAEGIDLKVTDLVRRRLLHDADLRAV